MIVEMIVDHLNRSGQTKKGNDCEQRGPDFPRILISTPNRIGCWFGGCSNFARADADAAGWEPGGVWRERFGRVDLSFLKVLRRFQ